MIRYKSDYLLEKGYVHDSGYDIRSTEKVVLNPFETIVIPTSVHLELPDEIEVQVRPRSSISKRGLLVHFGTVDSSYRGEIKVSMTNLNNKAETIEKNERIAQIVFQTKTMVNLVKGDQILGYTDRGVNGFGSTGKF